MLKAKLEPEDIEELRRLYQESDILFLLKLNKILYTNGEFATVKYVDNLIKYSYVITEMECGYFDWSQSLWNRYNDLKNTLFFWLGFKPE